MPRHACRRVFKLNLTIDGLLRHRFDDRAAEAPPIRRSYRRAVALNPAHREEIAVKPPVDVNAAGIHRERAVFAGVGRELMEGHADGLRRGSVQTPLRAIRANPVPEKIRKM